MVCAHVHAVCVSMKSTREGIIESTSLIQTPLGQTCVLNRGVLKGVVKYTNVAFWTGESVLISGVSLEGIHITIYRALLTQLHENDIFT